MEELFFLFNLKNSFKAIKGTFYNQSRESTKKDFIGIVNLTFSLFFDFHLVIVNM